uniref:RNA-dependent RNA polymerase n=2 Tax=Obscuromonas Qin-like virus TaxID=3157911 RepID=A0AAU7BP37_9VIRU
MARVFMPPIYTEADRSFTHLYDRGFAEACIAASENDDYFIEEMREKPEGARAAYLGSHRREDWIVTMHHLLQQLHRTLQRRRSSYAFKLEDDALWHMFYACTTGYRGGGTDAPRHMASTLDLAAEVALHGFAISFNTPRHAESQLSHLNKATLQEALGPCWADRLELPDCLRTGLSIDEPSRKLAQMLRGEIDPDMNELRVTAGALLKLLPYVHVYYLGSYMLFFDMQTREVLLLSANHRKFIAEVVWTYNMWGILSHLHDKLKLSSGAMDIFNYVTFAIRNSYRDRNLRLNICRHMKTAYSARMALLGSSDVTLTPQDKDLKIVQSKMLHDEALSVLPAGCDLDYFAVLNQLDEHTAMNFGTAWNIFPPCHADAKLLNDALREKYNAPRTVNHAVWDDFISYSRSAISAHYIYENRTSIGDAVLHHDTLPPTTISQVPWAQACRSGNLTYSTHSDRYYIMPDIPWMKTIEQWYLDADDVTHVMADSASYTPIRCEITKELQYVMENGDLFSNEYTPSDVRRGFEAGNLPGDRILYAAAKCENTKTESKVRETMSADDVLRACLSECDVNFSRLTRYIHGVAMRAGTTALESMLMRVMNNSKPILLSLDVSGWSPNMIREKEMAFLDMLMTFFQIPPTQRLSSIFTNIIVVMSRNGYFEKWEALNGSVQGFFGTGDTIMHTLMAQYCLSRLKDQGVFPREVEMEKIALIDDIVMAFSEVQISHSDLIDAVAAIYSELGFKAEKSKTIASTTHCNFLNRIYSRTIEIPTYIKIAAKSDREWERPWVSFWDEMDSILGSMGGAVDRGMPAWMGYQLSMWRILARAHFADPRSLKHTTGLSAMGAWTPRCLGGWGIPDPAAWITKSYSDPLTTGITAISVLLRHALAMPDIPTKPMRIRVMSTRLAEMANVDLRPRSDWSKLLNPHSVDSGACPDPGLLTRASVKRAISAMKHKLSPLITRLTELETDETYRSVAMWPYLDTQADAGVAAEYIATLPHAVFEAFMIKLMASQFIHRMHKRHDRMAFRHKWRVANRALVSSWDLRFTSMSSQDLEKYAIEKFEQQPSSASEIATQIRSRQDAISSSRISLVNLTIPVPTDLFVHDQHTAKPLLSVFKRGEMIDAAFRKTMAAPRITMGEFENIRSTEAALRAYIRFARAVAAMHANGQDFRPPAAAWEMLWLGTMGKISWTTIPDVNASISRILVATNARQFSVGISSSSYAAIAVSAVGYLDFVTSLHVLVPHTAVIQFFRAIGAMEFENGGVTKPSFRWNYSGKINASLIRAVPKQDPKSLSDLPSYPGVFPRLEQMIMNTHLTAELRVTDGMDPNDAQAMQNMLMNPQRHLSDSASLANRLQLTASTVIDVKPGAHLVDPDVAHKQPAARDVPQRMQSKPQLSSNPWVTAFFNTMSQLPPSVKSLLRFRPLRDFAQAARAASRGIRRRGQNVHLYASSAIMVIACGGSTRQIAPLDEAISISLELTYGIEEMIRILEENEEQIARACELLSSRHDAPEPIHEQANTMRSTNSSRRWSAIATIYAKLRHAAIGSNIIGWVNEAMHTIAQRLDQIPREDESDRSYCMMYHGLLVEYKDVVVRRGGFDAAIAHLQLGISNVIAAYASRRVTIPPPVESLTDVLSSANIEDSHRKVNQWLRSYVRSFATIRDNPSRAQQLHTQAAEFRKSIGMRAARALHIPTNAYTLLTSREENVRVLSIQCGIKRKDSTRIATSENGSHRDPMTMLPSFKHQFMFNSDENQLELEMLAARCVQSQASISEPSSGNFVISDRVISAWMLAIWSHIQTLYDLHYGQAVYQAVVEHVQAAATVDSEATSRMRALVSAALPSHDEDQQPWECEGTHPLVAQIMHLVQHMDTSPDADDATLVETAQCIQELSRLIEQLRVDEHMIFRFVPNDKKWSEDELIEIYRILTGIELLPVEDVNRDVPQH